MDESFHTISETKREQVQALMKRKSDAGVVRFVIQFGLLLGAAVLMSLTFEHHLWLWAIGAIIFAFGVCPMFAVAHETVHRTAFSSRSTNDVVAILSSTVIFYVPEWFRHLHFGHHRYTHDPKLDPELAPFGVTMPPFTGTLPMYISFLSGLALVIFKVSTMCVLALPLPKRFISKHMVYLKLDGVGRIQWEARICLLVHAAWIVPGILWCPGLLSILLAQLVGHGILSAFLAAEHGGLPHEGSMLERTRTTKTNGFVRYLMWNMPYHAEHHAYPAVPWHALPELHTLMKDELVHIIPGYPHMHGRILGQLLRGKRFTDAG